MHEIIVTPGLVLAKRPQGESHTAVYVLTPVLGLVRARAISARLSRSKLRYGLEPLTSARFSFVRGKQEWRLTGVEEVSRPVCDSAARRRLGQVAQLLLRLLPGAEPAPKLYTTVVEGFDALAHTTLHADSVECVLVLRILGQLGYLPELPTLHPFVQSDAFTPELAAQALFARASLVKIINESLRATGL